MQIMPGAVSGPITDTTVSGSLQVGLGGEPQFGNLYPVLRTKTEFRGWLPRDPDETTTLTDPAISPSGDLITGSRVKLSLNPLTFDVTVDQNPVYYIRNAGVTEPDAWADDYTRFVVSNADGSPFTGEATVVTDLVHGWIGGNTLGDNPEAWIMNVNSMSGAVMLDDWLLSEYGFTLPGEADFVHSIIPCQNGDLVMLLEGENGETWVVKISQDAPAPEDVVISGTPGNDNASIFIRENGITAVVNGKTQDYDLPEDGASIVLDFSQGGRNSVTLVVQTGGQSIKIVDGNGNSRFNVIGTGAADTKLKADLADGNDDFSAVFVASADSHVKIAAGDGNDRINYLVVSSDRSKIAIDAGQGNDQVTSQIIDSKSVLLGVDAKAGNDKVDILSLASNDGKYLVDGGDGTDNLSFQGLLSQNLTVGIHTGNDNHNNVVDIYLLGTANSRIIVNAGGGRNRIAANGLLAPNTVLDVYCDPRTTVTGGFLLSPGSRRNIHRGAPTGDHDVLALLDDFFSGFDGDLL